MGWDLVYSFRYIPRSTIIVQEIQKRLEITLLIGYGINEANGTYLRYTRLNKLTTIPDCWVDWYSDPWNPYRPKIPPYDEKVEPG